MHRAPRCTAAAVPAAAVHAVSRRCPDLKYTFIWSADLARWRASGSTAVLTTDQVNAAKAAGWKLVGQHVTLFRLSDMVRGQKKLVATQLGVTNCTTAGVLRVKTWN